MASLETKVSYLQRNLNRQLKQERDFPLVLHYSYNKVIRPRGDLLKDRVKTFKLDDAFSGTDEQFCEKWGVQIQELREAKRQRRRRNDTEKDVMWQYVFNA